MGENSKIEWCDHTFNPWVGCTKVSPGCANCYAEADMDKRRRFAKWGPNGTRVLTSPANWKKPLKWNRDAEQEGRRRVVFCASLADVFEDWTGPIVNSKGETVRICESDCGHIQTDPGICNGCGFGVAEPATMDDIRATLFINLITQTPNLIWRIVTKRPENIRRFWPLRMSGGTLRRSENVFLYTSVENQSQVDQRIPKLLDCTDLSPVLGISAEPLLERVEIEWLAPGLINHVIVGGESGPNARPFCSGWAYDFRLRCQNTGVPLFVKQFGSNPFAGYVPGENEKMKLKDSKGGDWDEWLPVYRVRELPEEFYSL